MSQWNLYVPAFEGATKVFDVPAVTLPVSNEPSPADTVCVVVSVFFTVTVAPPFTVSGSPNLKFAIVIVSGAFAIVLLPIVVLDAPVGSVGSDFEPELEQPTATNAVASATEHRAIRMRG